MDRRDGTTALTRRNDEQRSQRLRCRAESSGPLATGNTAAMERKVGDSGPLHMQIVPWARCPLSRNLRGDNYASRIINYVKGNATGDERRWLRPARTMHRSDETGPRECALERSVGKLCPRGFHGVLCSPFKLQPGELPAISAILAETQTAFSATQTVWRRRRDSQKRIANAGSCWHLIETTGT